MSDEPKYAKASWCVRDITDLYDVTDAEAEAFLIRHEETITELMVMRGWDAVETLAAADGFKTIEDEEDSE